MARYVHALNLASLPSGTSRSLRLGAHAVALYRVGDQVYASRDSCPHEGVSLATGGDLQGEEITCGYHFWTFNVRTGQSCDGMEEHLSCYPVAVQDGEVFVQLPDWPGGEV
jgi:nitrite reductase/ring-hydroxylating ferredoxin subunit